MKYGKRPGSELSSFNRKGLESFEEASLRVIVLTYIGLAIIFLIGYVKDLLLSLTSTTRNPEKAQEVY